MPRVDRAYAFYDIAPQAPVHVLVVPKEHITSVNEVIAEHPRGIFDDLILLAQEVVELEGVARERLPAGLQRRRRTAR